MFSNALLQLLVVVIAGIAGGLGLSALLSWFWSRILGVSEAVKSQWHPVDEVTFGRVANPLHHEGDSGNVRHMEACRVLKAIRHGAGHSLPEVIGTLRQMNPYAFEELVAICLAERGLEATATPGYSRDGGVDGWAFWSGRAVVIQAKRWKRHICNRDVRALAALASRVDGIGLFVHTGRTGRLSRRKAWRLGVNIISGENLVALVLGEDFSMRWASPASIAEEAPEPIPVPLMDLHREAA